MKHLLLFFNIVLISALNAFGNFPEYIELNCGESTVIFGSEITLLSKSVLGFDSLINRITASNVEILVDGEKYKILVGYENDDIIAGNLRIGVELISDYENTFTNKRIHLEKEARLRISKANETLTSVSEYVYPLFTPWNSGFRTQGWLTICWSIQSLEGKKPINVGRYHDGVDIGVWEGQLVRSVGEGIVVSPDNYPEFLERSLFYNKNEAPIGPNSFIVKDKELPIIYYYTHMSGLARDFKDGDRIKKGEVLGYASSRGSSGGWYHLHFSLIHTEKMIHLNPFPFLKEWYNESMGLYRDFLTEFEVYSFANYANKYEFERKVVDNEIEPERVFSNSIPGIIHVREMITQYPFSGHNHATFDQYVAVKSKFTCKKNCNGELWFGHTGIARLYLNGKLVYSGENSDKYHCSKQPFQWDSEMMKVNFKEGDNEVVIAIEQTDPFWSFSIRPRNRLGNFLK